VVSDERGAVRKALKVHLKPEDFREKLFYEVGCIERSVVFFEGFLSPTQRSRPPRDLSCSSPERPPDRAQLTAMTAKTATAPQITPSRTPRVLSPVHHCTPRLTNSVTTINTPMDNSTVAANLERILDSLAAC